MPESSVKIGLLSDTHSHWDDRLTHHLQGCDEIWHAGDIGHFNVLDTMKRIAPVRAVPGNIDDHRMRTELPEMLEWHLQGMHFLMIHIGGRPGRYASGIRKLLDAKSPDVFICGHSHLLRIERDKSWDGLYMNPGAAGKHGFHQIRTLLRFQLYKGQINQLEAVELEVLR